MRPGVVIVVLLAVPAAAQELAVEVFTDRGETYVRAGSDQGIEKGVALDVVTGKAGARKNAGTATVMEVFPALARVNLDAAAAGEKGTRFVLLPSKDGVAPPPPPPPSSPAAPKRRPAGAGTDAVADPTQADKLIGHAEYGGVGVWAAITLYNDSAFDWVNCSVTLAPSGGKYHLELLRARDHDRIARMRFEGINDAYDPTTVTVTCLIGSATFKLAR